MFITKSLNEFFKDLVKRTTPETRPIINELISRLLKQIIDVKQFLKEVSNLFKTTLPHPDVERKLIAELGKCNLFAKPQTTAIPASDTVVETGDGSASASIVGILTPSSPAPIEQSAKQTSMLDAALVLISIGLSSTTESVANVMLIDKKA